MKGVVYLGAFNPATNHDFLSGTVKQQGYQDFGPFSQSLGPGGWPRIFLPPGAAVYFYGGRDALFYKLYPTLKNANHPNFQIEPRNPGDELIMYYATVPVGQKTKRCVIITPMPVGTAPQKYPPFLGRILASWGQMTAFSNTDFVRLIDRLYELG